ncbi:unnamed protein product [Hymenolepis diminuta]|uniref:EamA domain-containing protein n=1 Tax=Hymenolepis diminuta TaxID=6216 RepID=A0A564Z841_HYMDI|nr:unnamed protein product [Hymenolepis diminuta]
MVSDVLVQEKHVNEHEAGMPHFSNGDDDSTSFDSCTDLTSTKLPVHSRFMHHLRRLSLPILLGQFLSALIATTGISSNFLVNFGVSLPLAQNFPHYLLLTLIYGTISWTRFCSKRHENSLSLWGKFVKFLHTRGWQYFIAGTIDVHANWAMVGAYALTNLTSVQLLDCITIPTAMLLSRFCLKTRYRWIHVTGVVICIIGSASMVGADYLAAAAKDATGNSTAATKEATGNSTASESGNSQHITSVLLGDFLVIAGAVGYGISNVYQEFLVRRYGIIDYLGFASLSATIWTAIYCSTLERNVIIETIRAHDPANLPSIVGCFVGFALAMFLLYTVMPVALSKTNAVLVNLSLLTSDLYALLIGIYLFGNVFHPLYLASFAAIMVGVCLFASRDPIFRDIVRAPKEEDEA